MGGDLGAIAGLDVVQRAADRIARERADAGPDRRTTGGLTDGVTDERPDAGAGQAARERAAVGIVW